MGASLNPMLLGAMLGMGAAVAVAFAIVAAMDNRYPTRREYVATLKAINGQLADIKRDVEGLRGEMK